MWVRGLKPTTEDNNAEIIESHPVWVRGLKLTSVYYQIQPRDVAPRVGAWIETACSCMICVLLRSHPVWVRGLKLCPRPILGILAVAPRVGAWIETQNCLICDALKWSHPVWVRGLKQINISNRTVNTGRRTPCGCVD